MARILRIMASLLIAVILYFPVFAQSDSSIRAVLFYSPTCPHCHEVINNSLPVISSTYNETVEWFYYPEEGLTEEQAPTFVEMRGDTLQILFVNTQSESGGQLYLNLLEQYEIPEERYGVPALLVGDIHLVGSFEIPDQLPGIIENGVTGGGIDWPELKGLQEFTAGMIPFPETDTTPEEPTEEGVTTPNTDEPEPTTNPETPDLGLEDRSGSILDKIMRDPIGNTLSIIVLIGMSLSVIGVLFYASTNPSSATEKPLTIAIPILAIIGILIAGYLTFVETTGSEAVCGPVGDCNTVQQSVYATLFGILPVGVLGLISYLAILVTWLLARFAKGSLARFSTMVIFMMTFVGTIFSMYLTALEPFVIGATCVWCLSSAVIITILMWLSARPAATAYQAYRAQTQAQS